MSFAPTIEFAQSCDDADQLRGFRAQFIMPRDPRGHEVTYLCGHSLGLAPRAALDIVSEELADWARLAVLGHHEATRPWIGYADELKDDLASLCGAAPSEVVAMNGLTVNLHLLLTSFLRPSGNRRKILIEHGAFPSDRHAVTSQMRLHGLEVQTDLVELQPRPGEDCLREDDIERTIDALGNELALVLWPGVQYRTGQSFDLARITAAAHRAGAVAGFDLAHAIGNLPLQLSDWRADFAVWCSYKYLNGGPGAVAGAYVNERHHARTDLRRCEGWWGHDAATRFRMGEKFQAARGADAWALSNPPVFSTAPLLASLQIFRAAGIGRLREKSAYLSDYLLFLTNNIAAGQLQVITPAASDQRGAQLSLRIPGRLGRGRQVFDWLLAQECICDWREPDIIRVAPCPLYNSYVDVFRFADRLSLALRTFA
ncbi:MAG: kynureninase [Steroidobacteraceae bacterium]